jgi:hypothetical protein
MENDGMREKEEKGEGKREKGKGKREKGGEKNEKIHTPRKPRK